MGGLGLDATGVFEVEANSTVTVGGGSGNVVVGTITAGASGTSGQINAPESFVVNIDSDNNSTTRAFVIKNNGSAEIARFTESGRLGLGTASPSTTLDVAGNVSLGTNSSNTITLTGSIDLGTL